MDILTEEQLKILRNNQTLNKLFSQFERQEIEITKLRKDLEKIQTLLNGELDNKLSSILEQKVNEIINKFAP